MIRRTFYKPDVHCAASGCDMVIGKGKIFCLDHYHALPKPLKDGLWNTWRAAMNARRGTTSVDDQLRINREYQAAFQACTEYLRNAPRTPAPVISTVAIAADGKAVTYVGGRML